MTQILLTPPAFDPVIYAGNIEAVRFHWPAGVLLGRSFEARLLTEEPTDLELDQDGDTLIVTFAIVGDLVAPLLEHATRWELVETTHDDEKVLIAGTVYVTQIPRPPTPGPFTVTVEDVSVTVQVAAIGSSGSTVFDGDASDVPFPATAGFTATDTRAAVVEAKTDAQSYADALIAALGGVYQPADSDLTAIAALSTTPYGRAFLALANQVALMALLAAATDATAGIVELATTSEATTGSDTVRAVTPAGLKAAIDTAVANLIDSAPGTLDTLNELAAALGDDPNFAGSVTTALAGKQPIDADLTAISGSGTTTFGRALLTVADALAARAALALGSAAVANTGDFDAAGAATGAVGTHAGVTTGVHGIADTSALLDASDVGTTVQPYDAHALTGDGSVVAVVEVTQAEYDALDPGPVATTLYVIVG